MLRWRDLRGGNGILEGEDFDPITQENIPQRISKVVETNNERPHLTRLFSIINAEAGSEGHPARDYMKVRQAQLVEVWASLIPSQPEGEDAEGQPLPLTS